MRNQGKKAEDYKDREEKNEVWEGEVEMKNLCQNELSMGREEKGMRENRSEGCDKTVSGSNEGEREGNEIKGNKQLTKMKTLEKTIQNRRRE